MRRIWTGALLAPLVGSWMVAACGDRTDYPPPPAQSNAKLHLGGGSSGGGAEASVTACESAGGQCVPAGDLSQCPGGELTLASTDPCGSDSDTDGSGTSIEAGGQGGAICCAFNDAGAPDDVAVDL